MKYMIVEGASNDELEDKVNSLIEQGWAPQGGVCSVKRSLGQKINFTILVGWVEAKPKPIITDS